MTEEQIVLGRRVVACKGWQWVAGMSIEQMMLTSTKGLLTSSHGRVLEVMDRDGLQMISASEYPFDDNGVPEFRWADATHIPDLDDPATIGGLLEVVRSAWRDRYASVWCDTQLSTWEDRWVYSVGGTTKTGFSTEAEALVAALEAAP